MVNLFNGDSFEMIRHIQSDSIDLVMTDVPYPDMVVHDNVTPIISSQNWIEWFKPLAEEIHRVLKQTGFFITTINSKRDRAFYMRWVCWMIDVLNFEYPLTFYWVKRNIIPGGIKRMRVPRDGVDFIGVFGKSRFSKLNLSSIYSWKRYNPATSTPTNLIYASCSDDRSYYEAARATGIKHKGKYPSLVPELMIQLASPSNGVVLDPFNGTGTTTVVAERYGRVSIGFEKNPDNITLSRAVYARENQECDLHPQDHARDFFNDLYNRRNLVAQ